MCDSVTLFIATNSSIYENWFSESDFFFYTAFSMVIIINTCINYFQLKSIIINIKFFFYKVSQKAIFLILYFYLNLIYSIYFYLKTSKGKKKIRNNDGYKPNWTRNLVKNHAWKRFGEKCIHACLMSETWRLGRRLMFCDGICWNSLLFIESIIVRLFY